MAQNVLMRLSIRPKTLQGPTDVNILYPAVRLTDGQFGSGRELRLKKREGKLQVLYLIHGGGDDYSAWITNTRLALFAQRHPGLMIVMPTIREFQSFGVEDPVTPDCYRYLAQELPDYIKTMFPVSEKREDTFIAGLSMGGYIAYRVALLNPDRYSCAGSMSSPLDIAQDMEERHLGAKDMYPPQKLRGDGFRDIRAIVENALAKGQTLPRTFQACGTEDMTYAINASMRDFLSQRLPDHTYLEGPGSHNWFFWDEYVEKLLNWLPLKDGEGK